MTNCARSLSLPPSNPIQLQVLNARMALASLKLPFKATYRYLVSASSFLASLADSKSRWSPINKTQLRRITLCLLRSNDKRTKTPSSCGPACWASLAPYLRLRYRLSGETSLDTSRLRRFRRPILVRTYLVLTIRGAKS